MEKFEINIGLFGCISVGKSTWLNAISGQQYSDTEIKKTTMVPQIYVENNELKSNAQIIRRLNREINESVMALIDVNKFSLSQCQPLYHYIDRICDIFDPEVIDERLKINIYDIPGLNDSASKDIYFEWVKENIKLFDIVIFMTDINKGLNSSDEIEILHLLMQSIIKYGFKMICLMNKCDDIYYDCDQNDLVFGEDEQEKIFIHANNVLVDVAKLYGISPEDNLFTPFFPISAENCFIYRTLKMNPSYPLDPNHQNRLCKNECGSNQWKKMTDAEKADLLKKIILNLNETYYSKILDTGYLTVKNVIQNTILENKSRFILNHIEKKLMDLESNTLNNILDYMKSVQNYLNELTNVQNCGYQISYDNFWKTIKKSISDYTDSILKLNSTVVNNKYLMEFKKFENLHSSIQMACINIRTLVELISQVPEYPKEFVDNCLHQLVGKLFNIYDQLCTVPVKNYYHLRPTNLRSYLELVKIFDPNQFEDYAFKLLDISCHAESDHQTRYRKELFELMVYIAENIQKQLDPFWSCVNIVIFNKQVDLSESKYYFPYLVQIKKLAKHHRSYLPITWYTPLDILVEVTSKQISNYLGSNSVSNFFGNDLDYQKINNHNNYFYDRQDHRIDVEYENKLLAIYVQKKLTEKNIK